MVTDIAMVAKTKIGEAAAVLASRSRFSGGEDELALLLAKHFDRPGFMSYGPDLDPDAAMTFVPLIGELYAIQPNLSFNQTTVIVAVQKMVKTKE